MHPHADFERMMAGIVRVAIFDARQGNKTARRWLHSAGLAERAGITDLPKVLDEPERIAVDLVAPMAQDALPSGKKTTVWEQGPVQVISVIGRRCCYGVLVRGEVKHVVPATKQWREEKAAAIALAEGLAA
jgi:hypothetical protein